MGTLPDKQVDLLGVKMDAVTRDEMVQRADEAISTGRLIWLTFVNVAILVQANRDIAARRLLEAADFRLCDGMGLMWASRLLGKPLPEMISGPYMLFRLLKHAASSGYRIYMLGSTAEVIKRTAIGVQQAYPGLKIAGYRDGYFTSTEEGAIAAKIRESGAQILLVGMGFPRERIFIEKWRKDLDVPVIMDVGGGFTVLAGVHRIAPYWMTIAGLQWIYRLVQEPKRLWKRYLVTNTLFAWFLFKEVFRRWRSNNNERML